jgi:hypothetical protein
LRCSLTPSYRFHFAKALYHKLKNVYGLGHVFYKNAKPVHKELAFVLRQYFALPMRRPSDMKGQLERLEKELRRLCPELSLAEARALNKWHNVYVLGYWFRLRGADAISVYGASNTTNNRIER